MPLLEAGRRHRDEWFAEAINRSPDTERGLLMLSGPVLDKVAARAE